MIKRNFNFMATLLIILIACYTYFIGCIKSEQSKIIVGVILAENGPADFIGKPERSVLEVLFKEFSDKGEVPYEIKLHYKDSLSKPNKALEFFNKFASNESVIAIICPSTSGESIPLAKHAEERQIPLLSLAASKKIVIDEQGNINRWVFKFAQNDDLAAKRLVRTMIQENQNKVALLYSDDGFGKSGAEVFKKAPADSIIEIKYEAPFPSSLHFPEPFVTAIPSDVEAVMIWGTAPGPALLVKALKGLRRNQQIYLSHGNASNEFIVSAGDAVEGAIIVGSRVLIKRELLDQDKPSDVVIRRYNALPLWEEKFSKVPSHFGGHARDALVALLSALPKNLLELDYKDRRKSLRDSLENLPTFYGVTGTFNFTKEDHAGLGDNAFETYRVKHGQFMPYKNK